ncbi:ATP-binding protein [Spirillospora sp. CA-294931]|uniref:ATP-binding protein n=1 Tax=Spirillospora sp. CA-294931 TaxID=3240042 RepID=UPI003D92AA97
MRTRWLGADGRAHGGAPGGAAHEDTADDPGASSHAAWELQPETRAASRARTLTAATLRGWRMIQPADLDDVVLMVDELITNAVVHGAGPVRLRLSLRGARLLAEVTDDAPGSPLVPGAAPGVLDWSEQGRGLLLVTALATEFGVRPGRPGKTVWFSRLLAAHP